MQRCREAEDFIPTYLVQENRIYLTMIYDFVTILSDKYVKKQTDHFAGRHAKQQLFLF